MLNKAILMGRLVDEPELKTTQSGTSCVSVRIAVERDYVDKNTNERPADFPTVVFWRSTAEFVSRYFHKGNMIAVEGQIQTRKYTAKDGSNRFATEIVADKASFTGEKVDVPTQQSPNNQMPTQNYQQNYQQTTQQQSYQQAPSQNQQFSEQQYTSQGDNNADFQEMPLLSDDDLPF